MHQELRVVLLLLVALVPAISSQRYGLPARVGGRPLSFKNRSPFDNVRRLIDRQSPTYGQSAGKTPPKHLDVALPMSILDSDGSLVLHLKDNELWEKENTGRGQNLEAALMPSYLKALERSEPHDDDTPPEEPEDNLPQDADPKELLRKLFGHFSQLPDLADGGEEILSEVINEAKTEDKQGVSFNLRDAFNRILGKHFPLSDDEGTNDHHEAVQSPGVFFNLKDLEKSFEKAYENLHGDDKAYENMHGDDELTDFVQKAMKSPGVFFSLQEMEKNFEKVYENMHGDDGLTDFVQKDSEGGVSFNIANIINEEKVLEKDKDNTKELNELAADGAEEIDLNEKLAEGLRGNNISVKTGKDGGLFFNLKNTQD